MVLMSGGEGHQDREPVCIIRRLLTSKGTGRRRDQLSIKGSLVSPAREGGEDWNWRHLGRGLSV